MWRGCGLSSHQVVVGSVAGGALAPLATWWEEMFWICAATTTMYRGGKSPVPGLRWLMMYSRRSFDATLEARGREGWRFPGRQRQRETATATARLFSCVLSWSVSRGGTDAARASFLDGTAWEHPSVLSATSGKSLFGWNTVIYMFFSLRRTYTPVCFSAGLKLLRLVFSWLCCLNFERLS